MRLELYAFEYFDELRKRWARARFKATKEQIAATYPAHRLVGAPEIREGRRRSVETLSDEAELTDLGSNEKRG